MQDDAGFTWVTCISTLTDKGGGPFDLDVRPALDDDSTPTAGIGEVNTLVDVLDDEFEVSNTAILQRMSPANFDTAYETALKKTVDPGGPVAPLIKFETEEEAMQIANDVNVGLAGYVLKLSDLPCSGHSFSMVMFLLIK